MESNLKAIVGISEKQVNMKWIYSYIMNTKEEQMAVYKKKNFKKECPV